MTKKEQQSCLEYITNYKQSQPNKQYRRHPSTFLNKKTWEDEIITTTKPINHPISKEHLGVCKLARIPESLHPAAVQYMKQNNIFGNFDGMVATMRSAYNRGVIK